MQWREKTKIKIVFFFMFFFFIGNLFKLLEKFFDMRKKNWALSKNDIRIAISLKPYWFKSQITPPKNGHFLGGGSTFWIFWWCNGRILLKIFLVKFWAKEYFWRNFRPIGRNFGRRPTNEISKIEDFWKFFSNFQFFFFSNWFKTSTWISKK